MSSSELVEDPPKATNTKLPSLTPNEKEILTEILSRPKVKSIVENKSTNKV